MFAAVVIGVASLLVTSGHGCENILAPNLPTWTDCSSMLKKFTSVAALQLKFLDQRMEVTAQPQSASIWSQGTSFLKRLPGVGSKLGSSRFLSFSHFHHFTAEPQRLPHKVKVCWERLSDAFVEPWWHWTLIMPVHRYIPMYIHSACTYVNGKVPTHTYV
jgi:hypothetical protein